MPFLYLLVPFCLGIVIQFNLKSVLIWLIASVILFVGSVILSALNKLKFYPFTIFLLMQLGYFSMYLQNSSTNLSIPKETSYYQLKIIESSNTNKNWNKGIAEIQYIYTGGNQIKKVNQNLLFYTDSNTCKLLSEGDIVLVSCEISKIRNKGNPGEFNASMYWKSKKILYLTFFDNTDFTFVKNKPTSYKRSVQKSLEAILQKNLPPEQIGLTKALFLGDKSSLDTETTNAFSAAGAMHLLAISGLHIGLMILVLLQLFRLFSKFVSKHQATALVLVFIWLYAYLIGFPPSVVRSVFMFSLISLGALSGSQNNQLNLLCFSAIILLLVNPWFLFDIGFQLSYSAMLGILLTYNSIRMFFQIKNRILKFLWNGTALGLSAQIFTIPLCLYYFHQFPNYFALTNLGIIIISGILISLGAGLFMFSWSAILSITIGTALSILLYLLVYFVQWIEYLPGSVAKGFNFEESEVILFYSLIVLILFLIRKGSLNPFKYLLILFVLFGISTHRYHNLNHKHLILFNNNKLSLAIHSGNHIYFFYDDETQNEYKYQRLLESYQRCYPGNIEMYSIKNKNMELTIANKKLSINTIKDNKSIFFNGKSYSIEYNNTTKPNPKVKQIGMPWVKGLHTTLNKAIIYPF